MNLENSQDIQVLTYDTYSEAIEAARTLRRTSNVEGGTIARVLSSPYGGYRVLSLPAEVYADLVAEGINLPATGGIYNNQKIHA